MDYKILRSSASGQDLELIFDHLFAAYQSFGDTAQEAFLRAEKRVLAIEEQIIQLAKTPHQGDHSNEIYPGLRHVTKDKAIYYYLLDETEKTIRILAIFFGGQDHQNHMLTRLLT